MRESRVILENVETYYHVSNEVRPDLKSLTEEEQKKLEEFLFDASQCCKIDVVAYTVYSKGYEMLIKVPKPYRVKDKEIEDLIQKYFSKQVWSNYQKIKSGGEKEIYKDLKKSHRARLFNLQDFVRFFAQRFSRFYNGKYNQKGQVWRQRFRSFPVVDNSDILKDVIGFVHTRPITREGSQKKTEHYPFSSWVKVIDGNPQWRKVYNNVAGEKDWRKSKKSFLTSIDQMEGKLTRPYYGEINPKQVEKYRKKNRMTKEKLDERKKNWKKMYNKLKRYVDKNGSFLFPRKSEKYKDLVLWVRMQRSYYRKNKISDEHKMMLDKINFPFDNKTSIIKKGSKSKNVSAIWLKKYKLLKKFKEKHGDIKPPYKNNEIYSFINYQRSMKKKNRLTVDQVAMLDELNFPWIVKRKKQ